MQMRFPLYDPAAMLSIGVVEIQVQGWLTSPSFQAERKALVHEHCVQYTSTGTLLIPLDTARHFPHFHTHTRNIAHQTPIHMSRDPPLLLTAHMPL